MLNYQRVLRFGFWNPEIYRQELNARMHPDGSILDASAWEPREVCAVCRLPSQVLYEL